MARRLPLLMLLAALAGCATSGMQELPGAEPIPLAPDQVILPTAWRHVPATEPVTTSLWWKALNDATLNDLVTQTLADNPDIKIAEARLNETRTAVADADMDEQAAAMAMLRAAENDASVVRLAMTHAVTMAYVDARLAEKRKELLQQRLLLAHELTTRLHRKLEAGLINTRSLRDGEQMEIETRQNAAKNHHAHQEAVARLAWLTGMAPIAFKLPPGTDPFAGLMTMQPDLPSTVIDRRPDVQAAWQRLIAASTGSMNDDLPLAARLEQTDATATGRDALYRKTVLTALQEVETALSGWRLANDEARACVDALELQAANAHDLERELAAGRVSQIELLKSQLTQNLAQENALQALHAQRVAFAATQLALARE